MPDTPIRTLLVEDNPDDVFLLKEILSSETSVTIHNVERLAEALNQSNEGEFDVLLVDLGLPDSQGIDTLTELLAKFPDPPIIVLTGLADGKVALESVQKGAQDYLIKGEIDGPGLKRAIRYAMERKKTEKRLRESEELNRSLYQTAERRLSQTIALRNIDKAISSSLDIKFTLDIVLSQTIKELEVDAADILLYNEITSILDFSVSQGFRTSVAQEIHLPMGKGYAGQVVLERKPIHIFNLDFSSTEFRDSNLFRLEEFKEFHCIPLITKGKVLGVLEVFNRTSHPRSGEWVDYLESLAGQAAIAIENISLVDNLQKANTQLILGYNDTIEGWSRALDLRDKETEGHTQRVAAQAIGLARALGVKDEDLVHIHRGALLHDIGKMGVPDSILLKPGPLDPQEWEKMKQHPVYAYNMLSPILYLKEALDIPYCHHEKWDGSGYPRGLKGAEIPFAARIFAVVDVYDALTSDRPYRKAWSKQEALAHVEQQSGIHFEPAVCEAFVKLIAKMD